MITPTPPNPDALRALAEQRQYRAGTLAYYDTFAGLIPCKVLEITQICYGFRCGPYDAVRFQLTADRGAYRKGEILTAAASHVPPRGMVRRMQYSCRIITTYQYVP